MQVRAPVSSSFAPFPSSLMSCIHTGKNRYLNRRCLELQVLWDRPLGVQSSPDLELLRLHPGRAEDPLADANLAFPLPAWLRDAPCSPFATLPPHQGDRCPPALQSHLRTSEKTEPVCFHLLIFSAFNQYSKRAGRTRSRVSVRWLDVVCHAMEQKGFCGPAGV